MTILEFPPTSQASEDGLLAIGGDLEIQSLITAYKNAIFPWPISTEYPIAWFSPNPRGVIFCDQLHIGRTLKKVIKKNNFKITFNQNFEYIIKQCSQISRKDEAGTWITQEIISSYIDLFTNELAYSIEIWQNEKIVAGLYGVCIEGNFSGESMFSTENNMSKIAFLSLIQCLSMHKISFLDIQMITPITKSLGGIYIPREHFIKMINLNKNKKYSRKDYFNVQPDLSLYLKSSK